MKAPHIIPYQGSKRKLASQILNLVGYEVSGTFYEPFAGSAALTLSAASLGIGKKYVIGDKYSPLIELWKLIIESPVDVSVRYSKIWNEQLEDPKSYFLKIREEFNQNNDPVKFLYLVARCVKNAIRFNSSGDFNQSADNRRLGMKPDKVLVESKKASEILKGVTSLVAGDFMDVLKKAGSDDLVYMDPPWQGTSQKKDPRYAYLLNIENLIDGLSELNNRKVPYLLSFDGSCGDKSYGKELPEFLNLEKVYLNAGRSSQATLLGRSDITVESLYLSPALVEKNKFTFKMNDQIKRVA